jgi:hypothetical protein
MTQQVSARVASAIKDLAGCCGLFCGLCPRYQSQAASRCVGCHLGDQRVYCSVNRCCVEKRGLFTCAECDESRTCDRLLRTVGQGVDSFVSHAPMLANLERIRAVGLDAYVSEQAERQSLVERLLARYNEGRSMTLFCTACALMEPPTVREAIDEVEQRLAEGEVDGTDIKARAKAMRAALQDRAARAGISLKLRR